MTDTTLCPGCESDNVTWTYNPFDSDLLNLKPYRIYCKGCKTIYQRFIGVDGKYLGWDRYIAPQS